MSWEEVAEGAIVRFDRARVPAPCCRGAGGCGGTAPFGQRLGRDLDLGAGQGARRQALVGGHHHLAPEFGRQRAAGDLLASA